MLQKRNKKKGRGGVHSDVMNDRERDALLKNFKDVELCKSRPPTTGRDMISIGLLPQELQYQRSFDFVAVLNLVAALVLSSTVSAALTDLLDVEEIDTDKEFYGTSHKLIAEVFNVLIQSVVTMNYCVVLYSTYYLLMLTSETSGTILRTIARSGGIVFWQYCCAMSLYLVVICMNLMAILRMSKEGAVISISTTTVILLVCQTHFMRMMVNAFPSKGIAWLTAFAPYELYLNNGRVKNDAKRVARSQLTEAIAHLGPGYKPQLEERKEGEEQEEADFGRGRVGPEDPADDGKNTEANNNRIDGNPSPTVLEKFLHEVFPNMASERMVMISRQLEREGLVMDVLELTAGLDHGDRILYDAIDLHVAEMLSTGEMLVFVTRVVQKYKKK